jgi:hypothetical protein
MQAQLVSLFILLISAVGIFVGVSRHTSVSNTLEERKKKKALREAQEKADRIVSKAVRESKSMLIDAELTSIKSLSEDKRVVKHLEKEYGKELDELLAQTLSEIKESMTKTADLYESYAETAEREFKQQLDALSKATLNRYMNQIKQSQIQIEATRKTISDTYQQIAQANIGQIQTMSTSYQTQVKKTIEANYLSLFQEMSKRILGKSMTEEDQLAIVLKALKEAKEEGFF